MSQKRAALMAGLVAQQQKTATRAAQPKKQAAPQPKDATGTFTAVQPAVSQPAGVTKDQTVKAAKQQNATPPPRLVKQAKQQQAEQDKQKKAEQEQREVNQSPVDKALETANQIGLAVAGVGNDAQVTLERIPTPGGLVVPLLILLFLWFILLPVNGKPRIAHLWEVIIGSESIQSGTGTGSGPSPTTDTASTPTPPPVSFYTATASEP